MPARHRVLLLALFVVGFPALGTAQVNKSRDLEDDAFWTSVSECRNAAQVELYLTEFPSGRHVEEARACLEKISRPDLVKLLGRGLMAEARDWETDWTDLHYAAAADLPAEIAALVGSGVPVDARLASGHVGFGQRLKEVLSGLGHEEAFQSWGADAETALMIAAYVDAIEGAAALVELGADISAKNDQGDTPLHYAALGDSVSALKWLAARGTDIDAKNNIGDTPLHYAALGDSVSALKWLVELGADIGVKNDYGDVPLHVAALGDSVSALEWLVELGADIGVKNDYGDTALDIAVDNGANGAEIFLRSLGAN